MNARVCPKCSSKLSKLDNYFCSVCGEKLPDEIVSRPPAIKLEEHPLQLVGFFESLQSKLPKRKEKTETSKNKEVPVNEAPAFKKTNTMLYVLIAVIVLGIVSFFGLDILADLQSVSPLPVREVEQRGSNIVVYDLKMSSNLFGSDFITDYIPADVDAYFESHDLQRFLTRYAKDKNFNASLIDQSEKLVNQHFAAFTKEINGDQSWSFIVIPKDTELVELVIEDVNLPNWHMQIVEDRLVITTHPEIFDQVRDAKQKVSMNLSLSPKFSTALKNVPTDGQVMVIVLEDRGFESLKSAKDEDITDYLSDVIDAIIESGFNEVVLKGEENQ